MKNLLVAFLLTAFVSTGYIAKATNSFSISIGEDEKDKKDKKSCSEKKSCCKMKAGEAKACAGMTKTDASNSESTDQASLVNGTEAKATSTEKKACCKKKASCGDKDKSEKGAAL